MSAESLNDLLALSTVPRWVIVPHSHPQSVAEHSFRVAVIYMSICGRLDIRGPDVLSAGLLWSLIHDGPESWTGDLPGGAVAPPTGIKLLLQHNICPWWHAIKATIDPCAVELVKLADLIEGATYIDRWGVGAQARWAARDLLERLREKAGSVAAARNLPGLLKVVDNIVHDIANEVGRVPR